MPSLQDVIDEKIAWFWSYQLPSMVKRDLDLGNVPAPAQGNRVKVRIFGPKHGSR